MMDKAIMDKAREVITAIEARTATAHGAPCPCGRGPAIRPLHGIFVGRYECDACVDDSMKAALAFVMDDSFGGP